MNKYTKNLQNHNKITYKKIYVERKKKLLKKKKNQRNTKQYENNNPKMQVSYLKDDKILKEKI